MRDELFSKVLSGKVEIHIQKLPNVRGQGLNGTTLLPTRSQFKPLFRAFELLGWEKVGEREDLEDGLVSCGCHTNYHKLGVLKEHKLIFHTVLGTRGLKSRCPHSLPDQVAANHPRHSWAYACIMPVSASIFTLPPPMCVFSLPLVIGFRSHPDNLGRSQDP